MSLSSPHLIGGPLAGTIGSATAPPGFEPSPDTDDAWRALVDEWTTIWGSLSPDKKPKPNEAEVSKKLVSRLLRCLGWPQDQWFVEAELKIQFGSKEHSVQPDYVLAPSRDVANKPGKSYAVIEVKRVLPRQDALRAALQQARTYADYLRVPFYIVADGLRIRILERRLYEDDKMILDLEYKDLIGRRKDIECLIGFNSLPRIVAGLRADRKLSVAEVLQQPRACDGYVFLRIRNGQICATSDEPDGQYTDATFWWGALDNPAGKRRMIAIDWDRSLDTSPDFVDLICRLLLHDGVGTLHVSDQNEWQRALENRPLLITESQRTVTNDLPNKIQPSRGEVPDPGDTWSGGASLEAWTHTLSASLDEWMVKRAKADLDSLFQQGEIRGLELPLWTGAEGVLDWLKEHYDHARINAHLLRAVVHARTGHNVNRRAHLARVRLGPASRRTLLEGLLFGLALSATFESVELFADESAVDLNVRYHQEGQGVVFGLDGLTEHGDLPITNEWERSFCSANLLGLTRLSRDRIELARARTLGSPRLFMRGLASTMGEKHQLGIVFTLDDDTRKQAANGWKALRAALIRQYEIQISTSGMTP
ncbi:ABC-three component system protein [Sorangium sp. So ce1036]|uniref:ABC-three component system protein n=1 Tax=Sorangium sp. So ce1036 TaxID=3133328 RepID=UPI003F108B75